MFHIRPSIQRRLLANNVAALTPELWARTALRQYNRQCVIGSQINHDFDDLFASPGEVVNLSKPSSFVVKRKRQGQPIIIQDYSETPLSIRLNQHLHISFLLDDRDKKRSFADLKKRYIDRAGLALAEGSDAVMAGEVYNFIGNVSGQLGTAITDESLRGLAEGFSRNNCPRAGRNLIVGPGSENEILGLPTLTEEQMTGNGTPIIENYIGRARGFDISMAQGSADVTDIVAVAGTVNNSPGGYAAGTTALTVTISGAVVDGAWCTIAGDMTPQQIISHTASTTGIVIAPGLAHAVEHGAVVRVYTSGTVNNSPNGYAFQADDDIVIAGFDASHFPKLGQGVSFGTASDYYTIIGIDFSTSKITLNRPLDAAIAHGAKVNVLPPGRYNLAFMRDALTFVNRPLQPETDGVTAGYATGYGLAVRVTFGYDMDYMRTKVTLDTLCCVQTLDETMGGILLG